ncbi:MAG: TlpA family protein disulfide reductase [Alphaproteobacteria bacterium]
MSEFPYENYAHYHPNTTDLLNFRGPEAGQHAGDWQAEHVVDGAPWRLSDHKGQWVVVETGCLTCPAYNADIERMNALAARHPDVAFCVLYVREAHPGAKLGAICSIEDKRTRGSQAAANPKENRTFLVDDVAGTLHRHLGAMPNSVHLIRPDGVVAWRSDWVNYALLAKLLAERTDDMTNFLEHHEKTDIFVNVKLAREVMLPTLKRAGKGAIWDIVKNLPAMIRDHLKAARAFPKERRFSKKRAGL